MLFTVLMVTAAVPCYSSITGSVNYAFMSNYTEFNRKSQWLILRDHILCFSVDHTANDSEWCCCQLITGTERSIKDLYWWGFGVREALMQDHANIMIWALYSLLRSGGEASCTLCGDNKRSIVRVCVRYCVCGPLCDGGSGGSTAWWGDCDQVSCDGWKRTQWPLDGESKQL